MPEVWQICPNRSIYFKRVPIHLKTDVLERPHKRPTYSQNWRMWNKYHIHHKRDLTQRPEKRPGLLSCSTRNIHHIFFKRDLRIGIPKVLETYVKSRTCRTTTHVEQKGLKYTATHYTHCVTLQHWTDTNCNTLQPGVPAVWQYTSTRMECKTQHYTAKLDWNSRTLQPNFMQC